MSRVRVVVLCAGKGKRMKTDIPKPLIKIDGKPILQRLVESIKASGVDTNPIIVTSPEHPRMCEEFGETCAHAIQHEQLGTAHALLCAKEEANGADHVIVLYGDHPFFSAGRLQALAKKQIDEGNTVTLMTTKIPSFDGWYTAFSTWARVLRDATGTFVAIRENKDASEAERRILEVNPGLYCFKTSWVWDHLSQIKNDNVQKEYYLTDLIKMAVNEGVKMSSVEAPPEEVIGINTPEERDIAEQVLKQKTA